MSVTATRPSDGSVVSSFKFERDFALKLCEAIGTPVALGQHIRLLSNPISACTFSIDPRNYQEPEHFAADYQVVEILKKSLNVPGCTVESRQQKALSKFLAAEARNAETNDRLWFNQQPEWFGEFSSNVLRILGPLDTKALNEVSELGKFGPGVNVGVRGDGLVPSIKYMSLPAVTERCSAVLPGLMPAMVSDYWGENLRSKLNIVKGNSHFTVPKNFEIDRCAAKEPLWGSYLQLGIGRKIERRLVRFGVDLHDQRLNQNLASMAHDWNLATLDLSSASDLMSRVLVLLALTYNGDPNGRRWYHLLDLARSPTMRIGESVHSLEMFSSMGNGYTFPLETALFLAVMRTCVPREDWSLMTAYGDDMIVPQRYVAMLIERLEYLGFQVNSKKTCLAGAFFESCGTDWFHGKNVRPFYLHQDPKSPIPYALQAANALRAWCLRVYGYLPTRFKSLWLWCKGQIPTSWRHPVPKELGDVGLHVSLSEARSTGVRLAHSTYPYWEGYLAKYAKLTMVLKDHKSFGVLAAALSHVNTTEADPTYGLEPVRGLYGRVRTEMAVVLWKDDFCWL